MQLLLVRKSSFQFVKIPYLSIVNTRQSGKLVFLENLTVLKICKVVRQYATEYNSVGGLGMIEFRSMVGFNFLLGLPCFANKSVVSDPFNFLAYTSLLLAVGLLLIAHRKNKQQKTSALKGYEQIRGKEEEILALAEDLRSLRSQLASHERMAGIGILTSGVTQEINNPNNFVSGGAQNLETLLKNFKTYIFELAGDEADDTLRGIFEERFKVLFEQVEGIREGSERIGRVTAALTAISHPEGNHRRVVDLRQGLNNLIELLQTVFIQVRFDVCLDEPLLCDCCPLDFNQALLNILRNGCEAILERREKEGREVRTVLKVEGSIRDGMGCIVIEDSGFGISEEIRKHIFEPFFTTREAGHGTGLGLYTAWGVVRRYGGLIEVSCRDGDGARFEILFPQVVSKTEALADVG